MKKFDNHHNCEESFRNFRLNYKIFTDYFIKIREMSTMHMKLIEMKDAIRLEMGLDVSISQCRWARKTLVKHFQGMQMRNL